MPKNELSLIKGGVVLPPSVHEVKTLIPQKAVTEFFENTKLAPGRQQKLKDAGTGLKKALVIHHVSMVAIGECAATIINEAPPGKVNAFLRALDIKMSERHLRRYASGYNYIAGNLPELVIREAASRNMPLIGTGSNLEKQPFGRYTAAIGIVGLPKKRADEWEAKRWLDQVEARHKGGNDLKKDGHKLKPKKLHLKSVVELKEERNKKKTVRVEGTSHVESEIETQLEIAFRTARSCLRKITSRQKRSFLDKHVGHLLTELGVSNLQSFSPVAVPSHFRTERGRPRLLKTEAATA